MWTPCGRTDIHKDNMTLKAVNIVLYCCVVLCCCIHDSISLLWEDRNYDKDLVCSAGKSSWLRVLEGLFGALTKGEAKLQE